MSQSITLNGVLLAIATFIIGSWVVPKMEWISNTAKVWIFAFGIGLAVYALLNTTAQYWLGKWIQSHALLIVVIVVISLIIFVMAGLFISNAESKYEGLNKLKVEIDDLIKDIGIFIAESQLYKPEMPMTSSPEDAEAWMQKNREYSALLNSRFVDRFHQRLVDVGIELRPYMSDEDWKHYTWVIQPEYPVFQWVIEALVNNRALLEEM